jgi:hypothetical protein
LEDRLTKPVFRGPLELDPQIGYFRKDVDSSPISLHWRHGRCVPLTMHVNDRRGGDE